MKLPEERWAIHPPLVPLSALRAPPLWQSYEAKCFKITTASSLPMRQAVWLFASYFRREFGYDFVQYGHGGHESDEKHVAFLWLGDERLRATRGSGLAVSRIAIGACCFRWREWDDTEPSYGLQWVWFHPFARGRGFLGSCWPWFCGAFWPFYVEGPLSSGMRGFLAKTGTHNEKGHPRRAPA